MTSGNEVQSRRTSALRWYAAMPVAMLLDPSISSDAKVLAGILIHYDGPSGCHPKVETLMVDLGASKSKVLRLLEELDRYGFLVRTRRGRNNTYSLRPVYARPVRPDSFEVTGSLGVENAPRARPEPRSALRRRRLSENAAEPPKDLPPQTKLAGVTRIDREREDGAVGGLGKQSDAASERGGLVSGVTPKSAAATAMVTETVAAPRSPVSAIDPNGAWGSERVSGVAPVDSTDEHSITPARRLGVQSIANAIHLFPDEPRDASTKASRMTPMRTTDGMALTGAAESVSAVTPRHGALLTPILPNGSHRCDLDSTENQLNKNHHQKAAGGDGKNESQLSRPSMTAHTDAIREAIGSLQQVYVNVTERDLGVHAARGTALEPLELRAWAQWVASSPAPGICNKPAFAAAKIRMGCRVADVFPGIADRRIRQEAEAQRAERRQVLGATAAAAQAERIRRADALIASLSRADRKALRESALDDAGVWIARNASRSLLETMIVNTERQLVLGEIQPSATKRDRSAYRALRGKAAGAASAPSDPGRRSSGAMEPAEYPSSGPV